MESDLGDAGCVFRQQRGQEAKDECGGGETGDSSSDNEQHTFGN